MHIALGGTECSNAGLTTETQQSTSQARGRLMFEDSYMEISPPSVGAGAVMPDWPLGNSGNPGPILVLPAGTHSFYVRPGR